MHPYVTTYALVQSSGPGLGYVLYIGIIYIYISLASRADSVYIVLQVSGEYTFVVKSGGGGVVVGWWWGGGGWRLDVEVGEVVLCDLLDM